VPAAVTVRGHVPWLFRVIQAEEGSVNHFVLADQGGSPKNSSVDYPNSPRQRNKAL